MHPVTDWLEESEKQESTEEIYSRKMEFIPT